MTKRLKLICIGLFFAVMFVNVGANFYSHWAERIVYSQRGWEATRVDGKPAIYTVDADGPAAVLRAGDEIVSLKAELQEAFPVLNRRSCDAPPGTRYKLTVHRGGQTLDFDLVTAAIPLSSWFFDFAHDLSSLAFLVIGLAVFLLKPDDKQARLLALMLGGCVGFFGSDPSLLPKWAQIICQIARVCTSAFPSFSLHFFLLFPERGPWVRRFPRLEFLLYLPFLLTNLPLSVLGLLGARELMSNIPAIIWPLANASIPGYLIAGLAALIVNYLAADAGNKRRTRVVMAGCGAGFLNLLLILAGQRLGFHQTHPGVFDLILYCTLVTLPLIPLSFAYAIIRHQVIPVSLIIRRSVRYVLVSRGAILLDVIAVGLSVTAVLTYIFSRTKPPGIVIGIVSAAVGIGAWKIASSLHDKYLRPLIDRRFFRQSYDAQQIIAELTQSLRTVTGLPQLLELVATKIQTALQTVNVTIFLRDQTMGNYNSAYSRDYGETDGRAISHARNCQLTKSVTVIEQASDNGQPVEIEPDGFLNGRDSDGMSVTDRETLREVKATLLMPLASKDELLGLISLGPRLGDCRFHVKTSSC